jgi:hypothetical protein
MINPQPVKSYTPPQIPTLEQIKNDSAFLKQMPIRWRKSAAVLAVASVIGTCSLMGLVGCGDSAAPTALTGERSDSSVTIPTVTQEDLVFRAHHGGSAAAIYIVYMTEQEALGMIRSRLEAAGLRFGATPPDTVTITHEWGSEDVQPIFYDSERDVAIAHSSWAYMKNHRETITLPDSPFLGLFGIPGTETNLRPNGDDEWIRHRIPPTPEWIGVPVSEPPETVETESARVRPILEADLNAQIDAFIELLQQEGIL